MSNKALASAGIAIATVLGAATAAAAADLPYRTAAPAQSYSSIDVAIATNDWTGFYVGGHLGGVTSDNFDEANSAWLGGIQAGYLHQLDMFVVGGELSATLHDELYYALTPGAGLTQNWSLEAKGRAGIALDQTLIYGTAGLAIAELNPAGATTSGANTHTGAVFGAGVEQSFGNGWSVRAEYQQTRFWDVDSSVANFGRTDDLTNHAITAGVNYRF